LDRLDASVAQLLNATYVIFVVLLTRIAGTRIRFRTVMRVSVALFGVLLITGGLTGETTWLGVGLMLGNALLFAGTVVMSQRILFEMPAPTVTLYVMTAMAIVVIIARGVATPSEISLSSNAGWAIIALAITTALSRISLFTGIKGVGSLQAALMAIGEGAVAVSLAFLLLDESLTTIQWLGVGALIASLFIPGQRTSDDTALPARGSLPNVAGVRFRRMAAMPDKFSTSEMHSVVNTLIGPVDKLTTQELKELSQLIGDEGVQKLKDLDARSAKGDT
jgi:drug/metabolite transporter (DMT)-like permease